MSPPVSRSHHSPATPGSGVPGRPHRH
jgi:hypothetical protein